MAESIVRFIESQDGVYVSHVLSLLQASTDKVLVLNACNDEIYALTVEAWVNLWRDVKDIQVDEPTDPSLPEWLVMGGGMEMKVYRKDAVNDITCR